MYGFKDWNMHAIKQQQKIEEKNRPCRYINPSVNMVNRQMHEFNARSYSVPILIKIKTKSSLKLYFSVHVFHWVSKKFLVIFFFFYNHILMFCRPRSHTQTEILLPGRDVWYFYIVIFAFPFISIVLGLLRKYRLTLIKKEISFKNLLKLLVYSVVYTNYKFAYI